VRRRLAIILSHPVQYYSPWFRWLAANTSLTLRVFYLSDAGVRKSHDPQFNTAFSWDIDLLSGYDSEFVRNIAPHPGTDHLLGLNNPQLFRQVRNWQPDAVLIFGYHYFSHLRFIFRAGFGSIPLIFRGDSHLLGRGGLPWLKRLPLTLLYRRFAAIIYTGIANREYYRSLGVPPQRLFFAPHCIDADRFTANDRDRGAAQELRLTLGLAATTRIVLFAGKFVPAKQPMELLHAFLELQAPDAALIFVGDGELKSQLQAAAGNALNRTIHFLPFANQSEMPARYLLADIFVLPSRGNYETWGLAVNEAMHMGVPCLVSNRVGCQLDLVAEGETGWVFEVDAPQGLSKALRRALQADRKSMAPAIARRIGQYTYEQASGGLIAALDQVVGHKSTPV
jgi:glycosyltransferase involved in cell wall biosynthesis